MLTDYKNILETKYPEKRFWFDTETTGVDPKRNGIHELACIIEINNIVYEKVVWNIKPFEGCIIEDEALKVSGITKEQLETYKPENEVFEELIYLLEKYVSKWDKKDKFMLYGYNINFDMQMLIEFFNRNNCKWFFTYFWSGPVDVMSKASETFCKVRPLLKDFKLSTIVKELDIKCLDNFHGALFDIEITREVFNKLQKIQKINNLHILFNENPEIIYNFIKENKIEIPENKTNSFLEKMNNSYENVPKINLNKNEINNFDFVFTFGKHKGRSLADVFEVDPQYIIWCDENIDKLNFSEELIDKVKNKIKEKQNNKENKITEYKNNNYDFDDDLPF